MDQGGKIRSKQWVEYNKISLTIVPWLLVVIFVLGLYVMPSQVLGQSSRLQDIQRQIKEKEQLAAQKKKEAAAEEKRRAQLNKDIDKISTDIGTTETRLQQTDTKINETSRTIEDRRQDIRDKEHAIAAKDEDLHETVVEVSIAADTNSDFETYLGEKTLAAAFAQQAGFDALVDQVLTQAEALEKEREVLLSRKLELEKQQRDLEAHKQQLAAYQRALDIQKSQKAVLADQAKQNQAQLITESNNALKITEELKKEFAKIANEEAAKNQGTRAFSGRCKQYMQIATGESSSIGYMVPAPGVITTCYGGSNFAQPNFHTGVDIANIAGTPIKATNSGTVTYTGKYTGYGNTIDIQHDDDNISRYAHLMQILVLPGAHVDRGEVIAYMGGVPGMDGAGWSTGAHIHFEIKASNGVPRDPLLYLP